MSAPNHAAFFISVLSAEGLLVDGLLAIRGRRRDTAMAIMRVFMETYATAAASGRAIEPMTANALANAIDPTAEKFDDADSIARHIPRIRKSIIDIVRQNTGEPIGETLVGADDRQATGWRLCRTVAGISGGQAVGLERVGHEAIAPFWRRAPRRVG